MVTCPTCHQPLPRPVCRCGHTEGSHMLLNMRKGGGRGRCSAHFTTFAIPCGCEAWEPAEGETG